MPDPRFYKKEKNLTLQEILSLCKELEKTDNSKQNETNISKNLLEKIQDVSSLSSGGKGEITFCQSKKYEKELYHTNVSFCFVTDDLLKSVPNACVGIVVESPMRAFAQVVNVLYPHHRSFPTYEKDVWIHPTARISQTVRLSPGVIIGEGATIEDNVSIGPHTVIGSSVCIGAGSQIGSHATIEFSLLGKNVYIGSGTRIGGEGFGFIMDEKGHVPVPQLGRVIVEDGVEIGDNCTIDRGSLEDTFIGTGTRIDNLVQIAHNVKMGKGCVIVAQVGIAGSTQLGDYVAIGGQGGLTQHLTIGSRARIAAQSGVMRDVGEGETVSGSPAVPISLWRKQNVLLARLGAQKGSGFSTKE